VENFNRSESGEYNLNATYVENAYNITFSIEKSMSDKIFENYYKAHKKLVNANGFRKGKVPKSIIETKMGGRKAVGSINFSNYANIKLLEISPYKVIHTYDFNVEESDDSTWNVNFKACLELPVKIEEDSLKMCFDIPKLNPLEYVAARQRAFARMNPILRNKATDQGDPLPAAEDDMVEVSIEAFLDGDRFPDGSHEATNIRLIKGGVKPESLYDKLVGSVSGITFDIETTNLNEMPAFKKDFAGKKHLLIKVVVNHVYTCIDPSVDDELAITAGYKNLSEWTANLTDTANRITIARDEQIKKQFVLEHINNIKYPELSDEWAYEKAEELVSKGYENNQQTRDELKKVARQTIILKAIGNHFNIEWDGDETNKPIYQRNENVYAEKVLSHLVNKVAEFKYVDPTTERNSGENRSNEAKGSESEGFTSPN
jgi:trigger factor